MNFGKGLALTLPQKFLGVIPLFIGVELVLGITILNKAGGAFGILSLFTGHPINFWQWLYNVTCLIMLPFYISGLSNVTTRFRNVRKMALTCLLFTFDTVFGLAYTIYFANFWFKTEDTKPISSKRDMAVPPKSYTPHEKGGSQSASPARELFLTASATIITLSVRFYFNLIIVSFSRLLIKQYSGDNNVNFISEDEQQIFQSKSFINRARKLIFEVEVRSKEILLDFFSQ